MKAVILVGGEGTRLRPLTSNRPKPMLPVINKPFIEHIFELLKKHDILDIVLSMCYLPGVIQEHFGDGSKFGVKLTYTLEETPLGTAGAVKNVEQELDSACLVFNGDILTDLNLTDMLAFHREHKAKVTIALTPVEDPTAYGLVETDADYRVQRFIEKPSWDAVTTNLVNAGTYIVEPEIFRYVPPGQHFMFERGLFPVLLQTGDLMVGYKSNSYWLDIGTPQKYLAAHHDLLMGKVSTDIEGKQIKERVWVGEDCEIHPSVRFNGPVVLGQRCVLGPNVRVNGPLVMGDDCSIERDCVLDNAVIWNNVQLNRQVTLKDSVVANNTMIEENCWITDGAIISDNCHIGASNRLEHGLKLWPHRRVEANTITF